MRRSFALMFATLVAMAGCAGPAATTSPVPSSPVVLPTAAVTPGATAVPPVPTPASPVTFTSLVYGYSIVVPAGWAIGSALLRWDAASSPGHDDSSVDKFAAPSGVSAFAFAGPVKGDLAGFVTDTIAWTVRDHGDTCPAKTPEKIESIEIDGAPAKLLLWNCGILINIAVVVHDGTGFVLVMRDPGVPAATNAADRAILDALLGSVRFAGT